MSLPTAIPPNRKTTNVIAASGRLRNEHFLLTADYLLLEVDHASFELVSAMAEGNIHVHLTPSNAERDLVLYAESAVFQPMRQRLTLNGWLATREDGVEHPAPVTRREIVVPTDGSFLLPAMSEQAEKRLPIQRSARVAA